MHVSVVDQMGPTMLTPSKYFGLNGGFEGSALRGDRIRERFIGL
jgi:hypothetical protein